MCGGESRWARDLERGIGGTGSDRVLPDPSPAALLCARTTSAGPGGALSRPTGRGGSVLLGTPAQRDKSKRAGAGQWKNGRSYDGNPGAAQRVAPAGRLARQTATRVAGAGVSHFLGLQHRVPVRSRFRDADVERRVEFALEGARDGRDGSDAPG